MTSYPYPCEMQQTEHLCLEEQTEASSHVCPPRGVHLTRGVYLTPGVCVLRQGCTSHVRGAHLTPGCTSYVRGVRLTPLVYISRQGCTSHPGCSSHARGVHFTSGVFISRTSGACKLSIIRIEQSLYLVCKMMTVVMHTSFV